MNKRVHEIAKERGLEAKYVLARLKAAGVDVKASSSSVDEEVAKRVLANGGDSKSRRPAAAKAASAEQPAQAAAPKREPAPQPRRAARRPARRARNRRLHRRPRRRPDRR